MPPQVSLVVVSSITPDEIVTDQAGKPEISSTEQKADDLDKFNHPRYRRALILQTLKELYPEQLLFITPPKPASDLTAYRSVHSSGLLDFLSSAWEAWDALGEDGQDPSGALPIAAGDDCKAMATPALIPGNVPLMRDPHQRPSKHVIGQIGYYCTDTCTPIFNSCFAELCRDAAIVELAVTSALESGAAYALPTHPGHHAAKDSFGGYCYINHAARAARLLQSKLNGANVAILDVDYHCGNGTASIFYEDPSVLVVSIHCDPDWDYPFHSGFAEESGAQEGVGTTLHLPLPPGTAWDAYQAALVVAVDRIKQDFGARAVVVSLGLDTHKGDPCTIRRAGFNLEGNDYWQMGKTIGAKLGDLPTLFVQEGGYRMETIGKAAADVVVGYFAAASV